VVELDYHGEPLHGLRRKTVSFYRSEERRVGKERGNQAPAGQFWAKHLHPETGQAAVRVNKPVYLTLHQAAAALALVYPVPPQRFGRRTAQEGVARAVVELDYHGEPLHGLRRKTVSFYQHQLQQLGVFPAGE